MSWRPWRNGQALEVPAPADVPGSVLLLADAKAPRAAQALRRAWVGG